MGTRPSGVLLAIRRPSHKMLSIASMTRQICAIDSPIREQNPSSPSIQFVRTSTLTTARPLAPETCRARVLLTQGPLTRGNPLRQNAHTSSSQWHGSPRQSPGGCCVSIITAPPPVEQKEQIGLSKVICRFSRRFHLATWASNSDKENCMIRPASAYRNYTASASFPENFRTYLATIG